MKENFRIVRWPGDIYQVHRVYYDQHDQPVSVDSDPVMAAADSGQHLSNLLVNMMGAFREPVLDGQHILACQPRIQDDLQDAWDFFGGNH